MLLDEWKYFNDGTQTIIVNTFIDELFEDDYPNLQVNVYVADNKAIKKANSVHDVMVQIEDLDDIERLIIWQRYAYM